MSSTATSGTIVDDGEGARAVVRVFDGVVPLAKDRGEYVDRIGMSSTTSSRRAFDRQHRHEAPDRPRDAPH